MSLTQKRIFGLDLVRAAAISLVLVAHTIDILFPLIKLPLIGPVLGKLIAVTYNLGVMGVELFFCLSGFLIGGILIKTYLATDRPEQDGLLHFWKMRWMRTLPAYYAVMLIIAVLNKYIFFLPTSFSFFIFTQNLVTPHPPVFGEAWSLSVEEWSYLTLPFLFYFLRRNRRKQELFLPVLCTYILALALLRLANAFHPLYEDFDKGIRKLVLFRLDAVAYGVLMAYFHFFHKERLKKLKLWLFIPGLCTVLFITVLNYLGTHPRFNYYNTSPGFKLGIDAFLYTLYPLCFSLTLPFAWYIREPANKAIKALITQISLLSYSLYLTHAYIVLQLMRHYFPVSGIRQSVVFFIVYVFLACSAAFLLHRLVEAPFLKWRDRTKHLLKT
ncbi:MAG TPA: acyltransferase [Chitinophagaceae bacterium]|nr:acyltransferase [Chitinophagaceae bacterium]